MIAFNASRVAANFPDRSVPLARFALHAGFRLNQARLAGTPFRCFHQFTEFAPVRLAPDAVPPRWVGFHRQKVGKCEGRKRYGHHQAHAERESAVVDLVRQLRRKPIGGERLSFAAITAELNTRAEQDPALRPRTAAKWHLTQIKRLLA